MSQPPNNPNRNPYDSSSPGADNPGWPAPQAQSGWPAPDGPPQQGGPSQPGPSQPASYPNTGGYGTGGHSGPGGTGGTGGPGGPGYNSPGYGGPGGPGEGPKKSRRGLLIGSVLGVLVLIAGAVLVAILVTGNDDDNKAEDSGDDSSQSTEPTDSSDSPTDSTDDSSASSPMSPSSPASTDQTPSAKGDVVGEGYGFDLPQGWNKVEPGNMQIDTGAAWGPSVELGRSSFLIEAHDSSIVLDEADLDRQAREAIRQQIDDPKVTDLKPTDFAGEKFTTVEVAGVSPESKQEIIQRVYTAIVGDHAYLIAATRSAGDDAPLEGIDEIIKSWNWAE